MKFKSIAVILCVIAITVSACSSSKEESSRKRRASTKETSTTEKKNKSTTAPTVAASDTKPITEKPFLNASQIKTQWSQAKLCALVTLDQAAKVLNMETQPPQEYLYDEQIGADCKWTSGNGDNAYIEISTQSFKTARNVDASLNANGTAIVISGVAGVIKSNVLGTFIELNYSGENSNQWVVNSPDEKSAKMLAEFLVAGLNK